MSRQKNLMWILAACTVVAFALARLPYAGSAYADTPTCECGLWGDLTCDNQVNPIDVVVVVRYVYQNEDARCLPPDWDCPQPAGDISCDGAVNPVDVVAYVNRVYRNLNGFCPSPCGPSGSLVEMTGCLNMQEGAAAISVPNDQDCIEYAYDGVGHLTLFHRNAGFNCCPVYETRITVAEGIITIEEIELEGLCKCLCLFDVEYEIIDLVPGIYTIRVIEPYVEETDEKLESVIDLSASPSGSCCVSRDHYPWGP